jgi:hypothetical protein
MAIRASVPNLKAAPAAQPGPAPPGRRNQIRNRHRGLNFNAKKGPTFNAI